MKSRKSKLEEIYKKIEKRAEEKIGRRFMPDTDSHVPARLTNNASKKQQSTRKIKTSG